MTTIAPTSTTTARSLRWRVVDIVVAAVIAAACGVIFTAWIPVSQVPRDGLEVALPGAQGLLNGPWLIAGPLAALIIRKPGAAFFAAFVGAAIELMFLPAYGAGVLLSGAVQGIGAEIVFAAFLYRSWGPLTAALSGAVSGLFGAAILDINTWYVAYEPQFKLLYVVTTMVGGAVIGLICVPLVTALAATGVLNRFASGRSARREV